MRLCRTEVSHVELYFGQAEECLIVPTIVFQTFFILLESLLIVFLCVIYFAQNEVKGGSEVFNILSVCWKVATLGSYLVLEDFYSSVAEFCRQLIFFLHKVVFGKVNNA